MLVLCIILFFFFFFQAEDGIRDYKVTGVQTCALPICVDGGAVYPAAMGAAGAGLAGGPGGAWAARRRLGVTAFRPGAHERGAGWRGHPGHRCAVAGFPGGAAALLHAAGQRAELAVTSGLQAERDL